MMRLTGGAAAPLLAALLLVACGSTTESPDAAATREAGPSKPETSKNSGGSGGTGGGSHEDGSKDATRGNDESGGSGGATEDGGGSDETVGGHSDDSRGARGGGSSPASSASAGGVASPAAGSYVYRQEGFEEFCSTGCERDRLPPRQKIKAIQRSRTASSRVVVTEARASGDRLVRTTTRYTHAAAHVTQVHLEYSYGGLDFSRTYRPKPPVASLRFPLRTGDGWSGRWRGDVSGSYSVQVDGRDSVGGVSVSRLNTRTRFRGDLRGRANVTLWVDPRDGTVMRTAGNMTVDMGFGTYRSGFETTLSSGP